MNEEKNMINEEPEENSPEIRDEIQNGKTADIPEITVCDDTAEAVQEETEEYEGRKEKPKKLGRFPKTAALLSLGLALSSGILRYCLSKDEWAAEAFYRSITRYLQAAMAKLTSVLPFSLAETLVILLPFAMIAIFGLAVYRFIKKDTYRLKRMVVCIFTVLCLLFSNYMLNLSVLYCRPSLSVLSGLDDSEPQTDELCASAYYAIYKLQKCIDSGAFLFDTSGASVNPYGYEELDRRIEEAFDRFATKNKWISPYGARTKIISLSDLMTYTHLSGMHTPYTGEANINVNYPDRVICATMAHEKAHQRGIAPEDEANLVAFFVLAESGDPYLEYCGYMSVFSDLQGDCFNAAPEFYYYNLAPLIPDEVNGDISSYSGFFKKYEDSEVAEITDKANDTYLKSNGEEHGVESYHMTSGLTAKYIMQLIEEELYAE